MGRSIPRIPDDVSDCPSDEKCGHRPTLLHLREKKETILRLDMSGYLTDKLRVICLNITVKILLACGTQLRMANSTFDLPNHCTNAVTGDPLTMPAR